MVRKIVLLSVLLFSFFVLAPSMPVFAEDPVQATDDTDFTFDLNVMTHEKIKQDRWIDQGINYVIQRIISIAAQTIGGIAVLGFSIGGLMMLISAGDDQMIEKGKNMMKFSLMGLVFVLGAYLLVMTIQTLVTSIFKGY